MAYFAFQTNPGRNKWQQEPQTAGETVVPNTNHGLQDHTIAQITKVAPVWSMPLVNVHF